MSEKLVIELDPVLLPDNVTHIKTKYKVNSKPDFTGVMVVPETILTDNILHIEIPDNENAKYISYQFIINDNGVEKSLREYILPIEDTDYSILAYTPEITIDKSYFLNNRNIKVSVGEIEYFNGCSTITGIEYLIKDIQGNTLYKRLVESDFSECILDLGRFNVGITAGVEADRCNPEWIAAADRMNARANRGALYI